jgi:hypothetical protein
MYSCLLSMFPDVLERTEVAVTMTSGQGMVVVQIPLLSSAFLQVGGVFQASLASATLLTGELSLVNLLTGELSLVDLLTG